MLPTIFINNYDVKKIAKQQGFAVLTSTILLTLAGMAFTANMVSSQLVDNQIVGNYYRNKEAFSNAESGVNFALSQLNDAQVLQALLLDLPKTYENNSKHYQVVVQRVTDRKLSITSDAFSTDGTANRQINLEVDIYINFPIPSAALSVNGKLNLDESAAINDGCEGLGIDACFAAGNISQYMLISNPNISDKSGDLCTDDSLDKNNKTTHQPIGETSEKIISKTDDDGIERDDWGNVSIPEGSEINGITLEPMLKANSLFEVTFGLQMNQVSLEHLWLDAVQIDMSYAGDCSSKLLNLDDTQEIIYIKGDCNINQYDAQYSSAWENKKFTIGSSEHPKLVIIEGGEFIVPNNVDTSVVGMLYFLPDTQALQDEVEKIIDLNAASVDMSGVSVNGALLSEYQCSHNGIDNVDNNNNANFLSARFDKLVLDKLYSDLGIKAISSGYRLSAGTWRDF